MKSFYSSTLPGANYPILQLVLVLARQGIEAILSPKQKRRPLPALLYKSFHGMSTCIGRGGRKDGRRDEAAPMSTCIGRGGRKDGRRDEAAPMRSRWVVMNFPFLVSRGLTTNKQDFKTTTTGLLCL